MKILELDPQVKPTILVAVVAVQALLLLGLSSRRNWSRRPALRFFLRGISVTYFPLMSYVLSYLTNYISSSHDDAMLVAVVLIQFLKAKADMAAQAVAAVASPVDWDDKIGSLKIRPSMESIVYTFWVAGLVVYNMFFGTKQQPQVKLLMLPFLPLWALGTCRMVLRFVAYHRADNSFSLGRNVELIGGYMANLPQSGSFADEQDDHYYFQGPAAAAAVPPLIVTGERNRDVEETNLGYNLKPYAREYGGRRRLVTLDQVWSWSQLGLPPELRDLCLSFALFKCLRRRFAGYRLAEAGFSWAFRFVHDGLLGSEHDSERIFRVIADELSFAYDFYYSALPVASLDIQSAALHYLLSLLILASHVCVAFLLLVISPPSTGDILVLLLATILAVANACTEIWEMVTDMGSKWTKISIIGYYVRCRHRFLHKIFFCLLRFKSTKNWKGEIGQVDLLEPWHFCKWTRARLFKQFLQRRNRVNPMIKVSPEVKASILASFRRCGGHLRDVTDTLWLRGGHRYGGDITWACPGGEVTTTTEGLLVWHIATSLFEIRYYSQDASASSTTQTASVVVTQSLSRYCAYLLVEAPDLLPDDSAWTKHLYNEVKKDIEKASKSGEAVPRSGVYGHLIDSFSADSCHKVLNKGSWLGKQLVEEAESRRSGGEAGSRGEDVVWELLAEFWSDMVLYIAPSDNVKHHIEALQRGSELITLLWALLLHAGITSRPARQATEP